MKSTAVFIGNTVEEANKNVQENMKKKHPHKKPERLESLQVLSDFLKSNCLKK